MHSLSIFAIIGILIIVFTTPTVFDAFGYLLILLGVMGAGKIIWGSRTPRS